MLISAEKKAPRGYRAIHGPLNLVGARHGVVLLDPDG